MHAKVRWKQGVDKATKYIINVCPKWNQVPNVQIFIKRPSNSSKYLSIISAFWAFELTCLMFERWRLQDFGLENPFKLSCAPFKLWTHLPLSLECRTVRTLMKCPFELSSWLDFGLGNSFEHNGGTLGFTTN